MGNCVAPTKKQEKVIEKPLSSSQVFNAFGLSHPDDKINANIQSAID